MCKQQAKYGDNRGPRPGATQGASVGGLRLGCTGGLEARVMEEEEGSHRRSPFTTIHHQFGLGSFFHLLLISPLFPFFTFLLWLTSLSLFSLLLFHSSFSFCLSPAICHSFFFPAEFSVLHSLLLPLLTFFFLFSIPLFLSVLSGIVCHFFLCLLHFVAFTYFSFFFITYFIYYLILPSVILFFTILCFLHSFRLFS